MDIFFAFVDGASYSHRQNNISFDTYNFTIGRNSYKIHGADEDLTVSVERAANSLVYTDSTQGWLLKNK